MISSSSVLLHSLLCFSVLFPFNSSLAWNSLTPPPGNSLAIKTRAVDGAQFYRCVDGDWLLEASYATLVDVNDQTRIVGNYSWVLNPGVPRYIGTWSLINNPGDRAESGFSTSLVAGKRVMVATPESPQNSPDFLALASKHEFDGSAAMVSYIARIDTRGGAPMDDGYCQYEDKIIRISYEAEFQMWKQDLMPPSTPSALAVLSARPIEGFFGKGVVTYAFNGYQWLQKEMEAQLFNIPGGAKVGSYFIMNDDKGSSNYYDDYQHQGGGGPSTTSYWRFDNPNGFEIVGKHASPPVQVTPGCLPWSLNIVITSQGNSSSMFGDYSHVQMVSTTGGLPPAIRPWRLKAGQVYRSRFTAIYWLYSKEKP